MKKILLIPILLLVAIILWYYGMLFVAHDGDLYFLQVDKCLDQWWSRNYDTKICETDTTDTNTASSWDIALSWVTNETGALPWSDRDPMGCIPSAGYTWSIVKNECIRPFEQSVILLSNDGTEQYGVAFSSDNTQAEIYRGGTDRPSLLVQDPKNPSQYIAAENEILQKDTNGKWIYTYSQNKLLQK
jgi:hypothetical protein